MRLWHYPSGKKSNRQLTKPSAMRQSDGFAVSLFNDLVSG